MNIKTTLIILPILAGLILSCGKPLWKTSERWEGIKFYKLRSYARYTLPDEIDDDKLKKNISSILLKIGRERAIQLLISYIYINVPENNRYNISKEMILQSVEKGKIKYKKCSEEYCEGFIDYNIQDIMTKISNLENIK